MNRHWGTRLGDVAEFVRGLTYKPSDVLGATDIGAMPCMRTKNIQQCRGRLPCLHTGPTGQSRPSAGRR